MRRLSVRIAMLLGGATLAMGVAGCGSESASDELQGPGWETLAEFEKLGGYGRRDGGAPDAPVVELYLNGNQVTDASLGRVTEFVNLSRLGVTLCPEVTDAGLAPLRGLANLELLYLDDTPITDAGLEHVAQLGALKHLSLSHTRVTDVGLEHVTELAGLELLCLGDTQITDAGLKHLKGMTELRSLSLYDTQITDAGLKHLSGLTNLSEMWFSRTKVTDAGLEHLKPLTNLRLVELVDTQTTVDGLIELHEALPDCMIHYPHAPRRADSSSQ